ncbi:MAG: hypothetical protein ABFR02_01360 [Campylobacterota bacterium]
MKIKYLFFVLVFIIVTGVGYGYFYIDRIFSIFIGTETPPLAKKGFKGKLLPRTDDEFRRGVFYSKLYRDTNGSINNEYFEDLLERKKWDQRHSLSKKSDDQLRQEIMDTMLQYKDYYKMNAVDEINFVFQSNNCRFDTYYQNNLIVNTGGAGLTEYPKDYKYERYTIDINDPSPFRIKMDESTANNYIQNGACVVATHFKLNKDFSTNITKAVVLDMDTNESIFVYTPQDNETD